MKNLLLSSLVVALISGCTFGHYGRLTKVVGENTNNGLNKKWSAFPKPIFGDNFTSFLFKTNITIYGKDVSGLLLTKQITLHDYRVIFTTELGLKLFDFEFKDTAFTLQYCVPQFNRPKLLKTIQQDIEILLMNNLDEHKAEKYNSSETEPPSFEDYQLKQNKMVNHYFVNMDEPHQLFKIEHAKKRNKKTEFLLLDYKDNFPTKILIKHFDIKLEIELNLLKR